MKFTEKVKYLVSRGEIRDASTNFLEDVTEAILGNQDAVGKIMVALTTSPFFLREQMFWSKLDAFLNGVYLDEEDCAKLRAKLVGDGKKGDTPRRLIECIDKVESEQKIQYLINATRCLLVNFIDRPEFFRICHAITHTLEEDLSFLGEHIKETDLPYDTYVQGLYTAGLMYISVAGEEQRYAFTPLAEMVDQYAVSYENMERYPDPTRRALNIGVPQQKIDAVPNEEIQALLGIEDF